MCNADFQSAASESLHETHPSAATLAGDRRIWRRSLALLCACAVLAALASTGSLQVHIQRLLDTLEPVLVDHPLAGAAALIGAAAIGAMVAFVSVAMLVPVAVFAWGELSTLLMLWIGWILGGLFAYALARHLGRRIIDWIGARQLLERCESWVGVDTPFALILVLQLVLPSEIPGYLLGLVRYPPRKYIAALALAELPYAVAMVYLGSAFLHGRGQVILTIGVGAALASVLGTRYLQRAAARRQHHP